MAELTFAECRLADNMRDLTAETSPETHAIIGAAIEVHTELGPGFLEAVYQEALANELRRRAIPHEREVPIAVRYKGDLLSTPYRADFVIHGFVVELKAIVGLGRVEEAQVIHYLKATRSQVGLLLNFGSTSLQVRRLTNRTRNPTGEVEGFPVSP
jgi:GxxExxY protein